MIFAPLSPRLEALAQALAATLIEPECTHEHATLITSNDGDGSARYDFTLLVCDDCDAALDGDDS